MAAFSTQCAIIGFLHLHDIAWNAMWFSFAGIFSAVTLYALLYPHRVGTYVPTTSIICLTDSSVTVIDVECGRTRSFAKGEISLVKAMRCDFARCSRLVVSGRRHGRHYRAIIAMYAELPPLTRVAEILNQSVFLEIRRS